MNLMSFLFSFKGRIPRSSFQMFSFVTAVVVFVPAWFMGGIRSDSGALYIDIAALVLLWPNLAVQAKRWHDRGKSAWWILINFIPIFGVLCTLIGCGFVRGTGPNRYGPDPLKAAKYAA